MKKLLMLCYYFPPLGMGGVQRPAKFAKYLPQFGWQPTVVTVLPIAYWALDDELLQELDSVRIIRTESLDPQRLLAKLNKHHSPPVISPTQKATLMQWLLESAALFFFIPDSKILWRRHAMRTVQTLLENESFDALYSTSPPHSTHLIAKALAHRHGLKWVADFRDSWAQGVVVHEPTVLHRRLHQRMQHSVVERADAVVAVSPGIAAQLDTSGRFKKKIWTIPNGFDSTDLPNTKTTDDYFTFCHCGSITPFSDPMTLLQALQIIKKEQPRIYQRIRIKFVGLDVVGHFNQLIAEMGLADVVTGYGYLSHHDALGHVMSSHALILVALGRMNAHFVPGKTFEYLGSGKPILAISNVKDTIDVLQASGAGLLCDPLDVSGCAKNIMAIYHHQLSWFHPDHSFIAKYNRRDQTEQLVNVLDAICE
jgi:glycosyltransferase involved in cell wall biosynthesis